MSCVRRWRCFIRIRYGAASAASGAYDRGGQQGDLDHLEGNQTNEQARKRPVDVIAERRRAAGDSDEADQTRSLGKGIRLYNLLRLQHEEYFVIHIHAGGDNRGRRRGAFAAAPHDRARQLAEIHAAGRKGEGVLYGLGGGSFVESLTDRAFPRRSCLSSLKGFTAKTRPGAGLPEGPVWD